MKYPMGEFYNFKPIINKESRQISFAELRVGPRWIQFSGVTVIELGYPEEINILASPDGRQLVIQPENGLDPKYIYKFYEPNALTKSGKKKTRVSAIKIYDKDLVESIRRKMGWKDKSTMLVTGIRYLDGNLLLFDLSMAEVSVKRPTKKVIQGDLLDSMPSLLELQSNLQPVAALALMPMGAAGQRFKEAEVIDVDTIPIEEEVYS